MQKPLFDVIVTAIGDGQGNGSFNVRIVHRLGAHDGQLIAELEDVDFEEAFKFATGAVDAFFEGVA